MRSYRPIKKGGSMGLEFDFSMGWKIFEKVDLAVPAIAVVYSCGSGRI